MKRIWVILLFAALLFYGCAQKGYSSVEDAVKKSGLKDINILSIEKVKNSKSLVFYENSDRTMMGCGLVQKSWGSWRWVTGGASSKQKSEMERGMTFAHQNLPGPIPVSYGIILNIAIEKVELAMPDGSIIKANIRKLPGGTTIWYALRDKTDLPKQIKGIARSSRLLYFYPHN